MDNILSRWWFQSLWKILVKMGIFLKYEVKIKIFETWNHHLLIIYESLQGIPPVDGNQKSTKVTSWGRLVVDSKCQSRSEPKTALPWAAKHAHLKMKSMTIVKVVTSSSSPDLGSLGEKTIWNHHHLFGGGCTIVQKNISYYSILNIHLKALASMLLQPRCCWNQWRDNFHSSFAVLA